MQVTKIIKKKKIWRFILVREWETPKYNGLITKEMNLKP